MAQRRMISDKVIKTDSFMEMPHSTKNLYFYLMIDADDDGFVSNPKTIMRMINAVDDDYKILAGKKFIIPFENGICVIKHWLIHNLIRADRKVDTQWVDEKKLLEIDESTQKYSLNKGLQPSDNQVTTKCPHRLGKVSIGKDRLGENSIVEVLEATVSKYGEFSNVKLTPTEYLNLKERFGDNNTDLLIEELGSYLESTGKRYKSHYATLLNWAKRKIQESRTPKNSYQQNKTTADFSK